MRVRFFPALGAALTIGFLTALPVLAAATPVGCPTVPTTGTVLYNPLGFCDINSVIGQVINVALGFAGSIALLMFVWGGIQMLISAGNADRVKSGKSTLTWAALGLVVIFVSYILVNALITVLSQATS